MKKIGRILLSIILLIFVTPVLAQFNSVSKKKVVATIYTNSETEVPGDFKNERDLPKGACPNPVLAKDTLLPQHLLFSHPLQHGKLVVTSPFGYRIDPFTKKRKYHNGIDLRTHAENVYAMMPGRIKKIGYDKKLGNYIRIAHGEWEVIYGHLYTVRGRKGDTVDAGHSIGISGSTGRSTGEHLHVSIKYDGAYVDPLPIIQFVAKQAETAVRRTVTTKGKTAEK